MIYIDCPQPPPPGPMAGHGLFTHIRRIKQEICDVPSPLLLVSIPSEEQVALVPESPYPMPTEPLWNVPYSTPYCECIYAGPVSEGSYGNYIGSPSGGFYYVGVPISYPSVPTLAIPEPSVLLLLLIGVLPLWKRLSLRNS